MTYASTVLADAPLVYFQLDETPATNAVPVNSGSVGGTGTMLYNATSTSITVAPTTPGTIGGRAWYTNNNEGGVSKTTGAFASTKNFTTEMWFKRDTGYGAASSNQEFLDITGNAQSIQAMFGTTLSQGQILIKNVNSSSFLINTTAASVVADGNWHHIAITYNGTTLTLYLDGVSKATATTTALLANTSATFAAGGINISGIGGSWDEPAFYNTALTATQIQAHYTAGTAVASTSVTETPPPMELNPLATVTPTTSVSSNATEAASPILMGPLATVDPAISDDTEPTVPAMELTLNTVTPTLSVDTVNDAGSAGSLDALRTIAPSVGVDALTYPAPMTMTLTDPAVTDDTDQYLNVPAMSLTLSAPVPAIAVSTNVSVSAVIVDMGNISTVTPVVAIDYSTQTLRSIEDRGSSPSTDPSLYRSATSINVSASPSTNVAALFKFQAPTIPSGLTFKSATLNFYTSNQSGSSSTIGIGLVGGPWTEAGAETPSLVYGATIFSSTSFGNAATSHAINITSLFNADGTWKSPDGIFLKASTNGGNVYTREAATNLQPYITYQFAPATLIPVLPMTLNLTGVDALVGTSFDATVAAPAMALSISTVASIALDGNVSADVMNASLAFVGGVAALPDFFALAVPISAGVVSTTSSNNVDIEYPVYANAEPIALTLEKEDNVGIDLTTNKIMKVANAMTANIRMVGIYNEASDPYLQLIPTTVDADDIWYRLNDGPGATRASDNVSTMNGATVNWKQDGSYFGSPSYLQSDGPELRPAFNFNGATDYLVAGPYNIFNKSAAMEDATVPINDVTAKMAVTIEFSIRTTSDGVVYVGTGAQDARLASISPTATDRAALNGNEVRIENGMLVLYNSAGKSVKVRRPIADGQWHHVVIAMPNGQLTGVTTGGLFDAVQPYYISIDGTPALVRYGGFLGDSKAYGGFWLPYSFMARATPNYDAMTGNVKASTTVNGFLNGDLSNVVIRLNNYIPLDAAENIYYQWSLATIVEPNPITVNLSTVAPFSVKGNTKKMLAIYGLRWGTDSSTHYDLPLFTYMSNLSGMVIETMNATTSTWAHVGENNGGTPIWWTPKAFMLDGYMVYPISITGDSTVNGSATSVSGVLSTDAVTEYDGRLVDDITGLPRFLNLQDDLVGTVRDYDVVTVVNYPWERPHAVVQTHGLHEVQGAQPIQESLGLSDEEWSEARDAFRDSLLQAACDGVNLWIGEYDMAFHLGFISGYDIHDPGYFDFSVISRNPNPAIYGQAVGHNRRAEALDKLYVAAGNGSAGTIDGGAGDYFSYPQVNFSRKIVSLVPDLTDLPSYEYGDYIEGWNVDQYLPGGSFIAYNVKDRTQGLQLGDLVKMSMLPYLSRFTGGYSQQYANYQNLRMAVISAHPHGIVGTAIATEQDFYYGPEGAVVPNPYAGNVTTIAAERGTVVRGRPIAGRVFIELMDTDVAGGAIVTDADKRVWKGDFHETPISTWDFDTRRGKEVKSIVTSNSVSYNAGSGSISVVATSTSYLQYTTASRTYSRRESMHSRGLNWLAHAPVINPGDAVVFGEAMTLSLTTATPTASNTKNPEVDVLGPITMYVEVRHPANFQDGSVLEYAMPISMDLKVNGLGVLVQPAPLSLSVALVNPTIEAATDTVVVYLDGDRNITLFLKEDN